MTLIPLFTASKPRRSLWFTRLFASRVADDVAMTTRYSAPDLADIGYDPRPPRNHERWNAPKNWSV